MASTARSMEKTLDRSGIELAAKLLAKAQSTDADPEAIALAVRAYSVLAESINRYEESTGEPRRRERRRLRDRRAGTRAEAQAARSPTAASSLDGYARLAENAEHERGRRIDFPL